MTLCIQLKTNNHCVWEEEGLQLEWRKRKGEKLLVGLLSVVVTMTTPSPDKGGNSEATLPHFNLIGANTRESKPRIC